MHRPAALAASAALLALLLAGCTATTPQPGTGPVITGSPSPSASPQPVAGGTAHFPTCDAVTTALAGLQGDLTFDPTSSATQTAQEAYPQRVCVYGSADGQTQLGVTLASIQFQQSEIDGYATLPNAVADDRLGQYKAVLQNFTSSDDDFRLSLFDVAISITIQGRSKTGPTSATIPALSLQTASDAAFAVRALVK